MNGKILIADDDNDLRAIMRDVLAGEGFEVKEASDGLSALKIFRTDPPDAVLLDMKMPFMDGLEALMEMKKSDPTIPVLILTAHGDISDAVEAIKRGAYDYSTKPPEFERLVVTLKRAVEMKLLAGEVQKSNAFLKLSLEQQFGKSEAIKAVIEQITQVAQTDFSVIIQGETGTGKTVVASSIHNLSRRAGLPFVCVDIGLIPDLLVESELFGYKKGAFTGADKDKAGYLETADSGTIFIDELENMSPHVQAKLLSFIEKKKIYPVGGTTPFEIDLRVIAATNRDIRGCIARKEFREDLFFRLGEFIINLPPLRERKDDIAFFARKFILDASTELNKQIREMTDAALSLLTRYDWPGNLRELRNMMRKAVLLTGTGVISSECLEALIEDRCRDECVTVVPMKGAVRDLEKKMIKEALKVTGGNKTKAAELLEVSYKNLLDKIKEYDLG